MENFEVRQLGPAEVGEHIEALATVLFDCVEGGASVNFLWPFSMDDAVDFFRKVASRIVDGEILLLAAFRQDTLVGTVQLVPAKAPNQPHRADVAKLLVKRAARGRGVGALLVKAVENIARTNGKSVLVLDTVTGSDAERLYLRLGWTKMGVIPRYALFPDRTYCDTTVFWKIL